MKKSGCLIIGFGVLFLGKSVVFAENEVGFELTADYFGKYIWRGQNYNDDPVFQPSISVGYRGLTATIWGSFDTTNYTGNSGDFYELDYSLDYTAAMPGMEGVDYSIGVVYYDYPGSTIKDTTEIYAGLSFDLPLSPSLTFYNDMDEAEGGSYISLAVGHSIEKIAELTPDMLIGMDIGASLGWGSACYNKYYWGTNQSKMQDLTLAVSFPIEIGGWTFAPSLNYVTLLSDDIRATDINRSESDYFFAGISVSKSF